MKAVKPLALLALIVGCGVWLIYYQKNKPKPGQAVEHLAPIVCESCGKSFIAYYSEGPIKCKFCGEKAAWECLKCTKCGTLVPVKTKDHAFGGPSMTCPKDGNTKFVKPRPSDLTDPTVPEGP